MNINELILQNLELINKRLDQLDQKFDAKFNGLKCADQNVRIAMLEKKEEDRKGHSATFWAVGCAAISSFGLSLWQWLTTRSGS